MTESDHRPAATPTGNFEFNRPTIVGLLYAGSYLTGVSGLIGLVLAYVWKGEPHEPWEATHYTYLIRSVWIALAAIVVGLLTMLIGIGFLLLGGVGIWFLVRLVLSLVNAQKRQPIANPETYLF